MRTTKNSTALNAPLNRFFSLLSKKLLIVILCIACADFVVAQCTQGSSDGYTVGMTFTPVSVIPSSNSCPWGYNYNLEIEYEVTFTGSNIPANLYTLQGQVRCGSDNHFFDLPNDGGSGTAISVSNVWRGTPDCNSATPASLNCTVVDIEIQGPGISSTTVNCTAVTLPIELLSFGARAEQDAVVVSWATAAELNNDFFTIERSSDGFNYEAIGQITGAGNSRDVLNYEFVDRAPLAGRAYYRLKQTDYNGDFERFDPKMVNMELETEAIKAFADPHNAAKLRLMGADLQDYTLEVISAYGAVVYQTRISGADIQLPNLSPSAYVLRFTNNRTGAVHAQKHLVAGF